MEAKVKFRSHWGQSVAAAILLAAAGAEAQFCLDSVSNVAHPGNPVLTQGSAVCAYNSLTKDTTITMTDASIITWEQLDVPSGSTMQFDFTGGPANPSVVNAVTGTGSGSQPRVNGIEGNISSNGRVVILSPNNETFVTGSISAGSFTGIALQPDDATLGDLLAGNTTGFGMSGTGDWFRMRDGSITASGGDVVLGAETVSLGGASVVSTTSGAVRIVSAEQFTLADSGTERIMEGGTPGVQHFVQNTGRIEGCWR